MTQLTSEGQRVVNDLAQRHGFSTDAVTHMLIATLNGNGGMAQFSHGEFGGSGQWMRGGMTMIGDMFNSNLKYRVDNLCSDISNILANQPGLLQTGSFQSQSQSGSGNQHQSHGGPQGNSSFFVPDPSSSWWPQDLGSPSATGSQNNAKYAYFANGRRLAVNTGGDVWVYDTQDHQIGGFSQQQGSGGSITFSSQYGTVNLSSLPVVYRHGHYVTPSQPMQNASPPPPANYGNSNTNSGNGGNGGSNSSSSHDIFAALERLGDLKAKGILTDSEFLTKKAELLGRL